MALTGGVLTAGGYWTSVFVQPGLADVAPQAVQGGLPSLTAGFVASYAVLGIGWAWVAASLLRAAAIGRTGWLVLAAAVVCLSPLPFRFLPLAVAVTVAFSRR